MIRGQRSEVLPARLPGCRAVALVIAGNVLIAVDRDAGIALGVDNTPVHAFAVENKTDLAMRIEGTAGDRTLRRIPALPAACTRPAPTGRLAVFDVLVGSNLIHLGGIDAERPDILPAEINRVSDESPVRSTAS